MRKDVNVHVSKWSNFAVCTLECNGKVVELEPITDKQSDHEAIIEIFKVLFGKTPMVKLERTANITIICDSGTFSDPNFAYMCKDTLLKKMAKTWTADEKFDCCYKVETKDTTDNVHRANRRKAHSTWMKLSGHKA